MRRAAWWPDCGVSPSALSQFESDSAEVVWYGRGSVGAGVAQTLRCEAVHVARGAAGLAGFPGGFKELALGEAHEDGVEGSGLEAGDSA